MLYVSKNVIEIKPTPQLVFSREDKKPLFTRLHPAASFLASAGCDGRTVE